MKTCSFRWFVCTHVDDDFLHIDLAYAFSLIYMCCANCVVNKNEHVFDDVLLYHTHIFCLVFAI
jgi:hypothetical protein